MTPMTRSQTRAAKAKTVIRVVLFPPTPSAKPTPTTPDAPRKAPRERQPTPERYILPDRFLQRRQRQLQRQLQDQGRNPFARIIQHARNAIAIRLFRHRLGGYTK